MMHSEVGHGLSRLFSMTTCPPCLIKCTHTFPAQLSLQISTSGSLDVSRTLSPAPRHAQPLTCTWQLACRKAPGFRVAGSCELACPMSDGGYLYDLKGVTVISTVWSLSGASPTQEWSTSSLGHAQKVSGFQSLKEKMWDQLSGLAILPFFLI